MAEPAEVSQTTPLAKAATLNGQKLQTFTPLDDDKPLHQKIPHAGFLLSILVGFLDSVFPVGIKMLHSYDPILLNFYDYLGLSICSIMVVIFKREHPFPKGYRFLLITDAVTSSVGMIATFTAYKMLPLGDASVIMASTPIVVIILARIFLKEHFGIFHVFLILLATVGLVCISQPTFLFGETQENLSVAGLLIAFTALFCFSGAAIVRRKLKDVHVSVVVLVYCTTAAIVTLAVSLGKETFKVPHSYRAILYILLIFSSHCVGLFMDILALKWEKAGIVAIGRLTDVVFAYMWQVVIFGKPPGMLSITGGIIVVIAVVLMGVKKLLDEKE